MPNITLKRFMIFNSSEGCDESREGDKLLYHWTKEGRVSSTEQIDDICLCDASVNVSNRLNCDKFIRQTTSQEQSSQTSCETKPACLKSKPIGQNNSLVLTFDKTLVLIVLVESELSIWMAIHVSPPTDIGNQVHSDLSCIPTDAIERAMSNIYARFCLLNGSFKMIAEDVKADLAETDERKKASIRDRMRVVCDDYFSSVIPNIHLNSIISNVASLYNYILYLDLSPLILLKVNSFINHLVCLDAIHISHTIVIFNDQLLWSSLNMYDTRILYNYMVSVLIRDALQEELSKEVDKVRRIRENMPIYLTQEPSSSIIKSYLTVFRSSNNLTLGIILSKPDMFDLIEKLSVVPLAPLAQSVGQNFLRANSSPGGTSSKGLAQLTEQKYLYINRSYASISWPHSVDMRNKEHLLLSALDNNGLEIRLIRYLIDLEPELYDIGRQSGNRSVEEFFGRTLNDSWLTVTNSRYRTIYSVNNIRNSGLTEAKQSAVDLMTTFANNRS